MLVEVRRMKQTAADKPTEAVVEYLNPASIERVRPGKRPGTADVLVHDEWITCLGEPEEFAKAANGIFLDLRTTDG